MRYSRTVFRLPVSICGGRMYVRSMLQNNESKNKRKNVLFRRKRVLSHILEYKIKNAMRCEEPHRPLGSSTDWDTIEELSATLNDVDTELSELEKERECWDEFECRIYDL